jgi:hypothetical protein
LLPIGHVEPPMPTKRQLEILRAMIAAADSPCLVGEDDGSEEIFAEDMSEIVCDEGGCWLGYERVTRRTIDGLLSVCAITLVSEPGSLERYGVTGTGRRIADDPKVADKVMKALLSPGAYDSGGNPI